MIKENLTREMCLVQCLTFMYISKVQIGLRIIFYNANIIMIAERKYKNDMMRIQGSHINRNRMIKRNIY
jgi:hypothetical protein